MLFEMLASLMFTIFSFFVSLFPDVNVSNIVVYQTHVDNLETMFQNASYYFPLDTLFTIFGIIFTIEFSILTFRIARYILSNVSLGILK